MNKPIIWAALLVIFLGACNEPAQNTAYPKGRLYYGGDILTMVGDQPQYVESLIVENGRIVYTGPEQEARELLGADAASVHLEGQTLIPGFMDAHSHFIQSAAKRSTVSLDPPPAGDVQSINDIIKKMQQDLAVNPRTGNEWLVGWGFDNGMLSDKRFPTREDLDAISTDVPIVIIHFSSHMLVLNSAGLKRAGYDDNYVAPSGGTIRRDAQGQPNGVIEETAMIQAFMTLTRDVLGPEAGMRLGFPIRDGDMLKLLKQTQDEYLS